MTRGRAAVLFVVILLCAVFVAEESYHWQDSGPVYSVAALQNQISADPQGWMGRTVWVAPTNMPFSAFPDRPYTVGAQQYLRLIDRTDLHFLYVTPGGQDFYRAFLRAIPFFDRFGPVPQDPVTAVYTAMPLRVRIQPLVATLCAFAPCYAAVVLDSGGGFVWGDSLPYPCNPPLDVQQLPATLPSTPKVCTT